MFATDLGLKETIVNGRDTILVFMELKNPLVKVLGR